MRLVVDTSVLVGELLRRSGRERLGDGRLELFLPEQMWAEAQVERPRPIAAFVRRRGLEPVVAEELSRLCLTAVEANAVVLDEAIYSALEDEARARSLRDPADWPVAAAALALSAGHLDERQRLPRHGRRNVDDRELAGVVWPQAPQRDAPWRRGDVACHVAAVSGVRAGPRARLACRAASGG